MHCPLIIEKFMSASRSFYIPVALFLTLVLSNGALAQNERKIAYGILLDNTGSMRTQFSQVNMLGKGVVKHIHPNGPISIFNFTTQGHKREPLALVKSGVEWSQDKNIIDGYIDRLSVVAGQTTLKDAIYSIAEGLNIKVNLDKDAYAGRS